MVAECRIALSSASGQKRILDACTKRTVMEKKLCVSLINERYFVVDDDYRGRQEYWIEKF